MPRDATSSSSLRFPPLHPRQSLRRLRTAFVSSACSSPPSSSTSPTPRSLSSTRSPYQGSPPSHSSTPLSASTSSQHSRFSGYYSFGSLSTPALVVESRDSDIPPMPSHRLIRRKKSQLELERDEERTCVANELVALVEPRPGFGPTLGGIEEVLDGRV